MKKTLFALAVMATFSAPVMAEHSYEQSGHRYHRVHDMRTEHAIEHYQKRNHDASTFSTDYFEAGYALTDFGGDIGESDGFYLNARKSIGTHLYLHGFYSDQSLKDYPVSGDTYNIGVGAHKPLYTNYGYQVTGYVQAGMGSVSGSYSSSVASGSDTVDGMTYNMGLSTNLGENGVELGVSLDHYDFGSNENGYSFNGVLPLTQDVSISGKYSRIDTSDLYFAGLRYQF